MTHPTAHKIKDFFRKKETPIMMVANAATLIPGVPPSIPNVISQFFTRKHYG
jgi:hypothetical protein